MSIVPYRATKGDVLAAITAVATDPKVHAFANRAYSLLSKGFPVGPTTSANNQLSYRPQSLRSVSRKKKRNRRRSRGSTQSRAAMRPSKAISEVNITVEFPIIYTLTTAAMTGIIGGSIWIGYKNTNSYSDLQVSGPYVNLAAAFADQNILGFTAEYVPATPYTTSGAFAVGWNMDYSISGFAPTSLQSVSQSDNSTISDVKECSKIEWRPSNEEESEAKAIKDASGVASGSQLLRSYAPGLISFYAVTNLTAGATTFGYLKVSLRVKFERVHP